MLERAKTLKERLFVRRLRQEASELRRVAKGFRRDELFRKPGERKVAGFAVARPVVTLNLFAVHLVNCIIFLHKGC